MKKYKTIIIGAGISGIGCAYNLLKNKYTDFKIISPTIGGRIMESDSGTVEYGAYYIMGIYHNTKSFIEKGRRIYPHQLIFHNRKRFYGVFDKKVFRNLAELSRLIFILLKFKRHYSKFKKNNLYESQITCLKKDPYLWKLYNQNATELIKEKNIKHIVYDYIAEVLHGTAFAPIEKLNAFTFLHFSLPLIVPIYEFIFKKEEIKKRIKKNYIKDSIVTIQKENTGLYKLTTKLNKTFYCKNLVIATPPHISKKLLSLKNKLRGPANAHMFHIIGELIKKWRGNHIHLFRNKSRMLAISNQEDNSFLVYSVHKDINFSKYFFDYKILKHHYWKPAFGITGNNLLKFNQGDNLYLIGDNNLVGLEPCYIYGKYCANKLLGKTKD